MLAIIPPISSQVSAEHDRPRSRINFRVQQVFLCILTVGVTCWLWRINPIVGIAATFLAKHILVAILASGLTYPSIRDAQEPEGTSLPEVS